MTNMKKITSGALALIFAAQLAPMTLAANSVPNKFSYTGSLIDESGAPAAGQYDFRFSLWSDGDYLTTDTTVLNSINAAAVNYSGYIEEQTITPNDDGSFFAEVGAVNPLPNLNIADHGYLQVEVKPAGAADSDYLLLDPDQDITTTLDRKPLNSSPFAINSDTVDNTDIGTAEGQLATLGAGGTWTVGQMADGTNAEIFTLNANGSAGDVSLQFGGTLGKTINYDTIGGKFIINDGLFVDDNLAVSGDVFIDGLLNGRDLNADMAALDQSVANVAALTATATALETSLATTTAELAAIDTALANTNAMQAADLATTEASIADLTADITATNAALAQTQADLTAATTTLTDALAAVQAEQVAADAALAADITANAIAIAAAEQAIADLSATQADISAALTANEAAVTALTNSTAASITTIQADIDGLTADVAATNAALDITTADTATSLTQLSDALTTVQADLNTLGATVAAEDAALAADIIALATTLNAVETEIAALTGSDTTLTADIATNTASINAVNTALTAAQTDIANLEAVIIQAQADTNALATSLTVLDSQLATNSTNLNAITAAVTASDAAIAALDTRVGSVEAVAHAANTDTGTINTSFTLNNGDASTISTLQFGSTLARSISYDTTAGKFTINDGVFVDDSLAVSGSIYVDGLVDGRDIAADGTRLDAITAQLIALENSISGIASNVVNTFNWNYIPEANGKIKNGDIGQLDDAVMTRAGSIQKLSLSGKGRKFNGTYFITKNDGGTFNEDAVMTKIEVRQSPTISTTFIAGIAGLDFAAGDIVRMYHSDDDQRSIKAALEVIYE